MEEKELQKELQIINEQAKAVLIIKDKETFETAGNIILKIDAYTKGVHTFCDDNIKKADILHKSLIKQRGLLLNPALNLRDALVRGTNKYSTEQKHIAEEAQRLANEEREKAEQKEREKLEKRAERAEENGKTEKAETLREQAASVYVAPIIVQPEIEKTTRTEAGTISAKDDVELVVNDPLKIIQAVVKGVLPITVVKVQEVELKKYIKAMKWKELDGCNIEWVTKNSFRKGAA